MKDCFFRQRLAFVKLLFHRMSCISIRFTLAKLFAVAIVVAGTSCGNDIPDCPSKLCTLAGGWRLEEVRVNGVKDNTIDIEQYRLILHMPTPQTAVTSIFDRRNPSGRQDTGTWGLTNNNTVLALSPSQSPVENYIISKSTPREMILITDLEEDKTGHDEYTFVLVPF